MGKPRPIVQLRGAGAKAAKQFLFDSSDVDGAGMKCMSDNVNLGGVKLRNVNASAAIAPLASCVFGAGSMCVHQHVDIVRSHMRSRLLYNVHTCSSSMENLEPY